MGRTVAVIWLLGRASRRPGSCWQAGWSSTWTPTLITARSGKGGCCSGRQERATVSTRQAWPANTAESLARVVAAGRVLRRYPRARAGARLGGAPRAGGHGPAHRLLLPVLLRQVDVVAHYRVAPPELGPVLGVEVDGGIPERLRLIFLLAQIKHGIGQRPQRSPAEQRGHVTELAGVGRFEPCAVARNHRSPWIGGQTRVAAGQDDVDVLAGLLLELRNPAATWVSRRCVRHVHAAVADQCPASLVQHLRSYDRRHVLVALGKEGDYVISGRNRGPIDWRITEQHPDLLRRGQRPVNGPDESVELLIDRRVPRRHG